MIGTYSLTTDTKYIAEKIEESIHSTRNEMKKNLESITSDIYSMLVDKFDEHFSYDNSENYKLTIAHEVRVIMKNLLLGDLDQIKQLNILDEYTFDNLHEIRLKIYETCNKGIENMIILNQKNEIDSLKKEVKFHMRDY